MIRVVVMLGSMFIWAGITAVDLATGEAFAQMHPAIASLYTFNANIIPGRYRLDDGFIQVRTIGHIKLY